MIYLGQENDFSKTSYSLTLFEAFFRHLLGTLPVNNAFFELLCGIFGSRKFYKFIYYLRGSSLNCPKFTKTRPFLLTLCACPGNYADI